MQHIIWCWNSTLCNIKCTWLILKPRPFCMPVIEAPNCCCYVKPLPPSYCIRIRKLSRQIVCVCVLGDCNPLDLVILLDWVKFPEEGVSAPSVWLHVAIRHTHLHASYHCCTRMYTPTPETVCFTPTPHAHTLNCSAAENVFLISSLFSLFHSLFPLKRPLIRAVSRFFF